MSQKGLSLTFLLLVVTILLGLGGLFYYFNQVKDNPTKIFDRPGDLKQLYDKKNRQVLESESKSKSSNPLNSAGAGISNPASENCIKVGGTLESETRGDGGEYAVCMFEDNQSCEEWALFRRDCPIGGIKTIGYDSPEQIYCVQIGGKTIAESNAKCTLPNGNVCSNEDLYNGKCQ